MLSASEKREALHNYILYGKPMPSKDTLQRLTYRLSQLDKKLGDENLAMVRLNPSLYFNPNKFGQINNEADWWSKAFAIPSSIGLAFLINQIHKPGVHPAHILASLYVFSKIYTPVIKKLQFGVSPLDE